MARQFPPRRFHFDDVSAFICKCLTAIRARDKVAELDDFDTFERQGDFVAA
jgi:hypothetical protein